jgi:hypothetical protein
LGPPTLAAISGEGIRNTRLNGVEGLPGPAFAMPWDETNLDARDLLVTCTSNIYRERNAMTASGR